jgi:hypothetical protein
MATNPMPYTFGTATSAIPLSQLDTNFATPVTLGNTAVYLNNTYSSIGNLTLANVTITSGTVTITNVAVTTANVSGTANISTLVVTANASVAGNVTVSGNTVVTGNVTSATHILTGGTANGVVYLDTTKALTTGSALTFDGTNLRVGTTSSLSVADKLTVVGGNFAVQRTSGITTFMGDNTGDGYAGTATNQAFALLTNSVERARIDTSGNLLVGTLSPSATYGKLTVAGGISITPDSSSKFQIGRYSAGAPYSYIKMGSTSSGLKFTDPADSVDLMTLDSSGNFFVGKTAINTTNTGFSVDANFGFGGGGVRVVNSLSTGSADGFQMYSTGAGAYRFYINFAGQIFATNTSISAISDIRFKENVRDLNVGLAEVLALKPRLYVWKEGKGADVKNARGFIAQEFEEVFPDLIDEWKDPAPEGEEPYKSVRADIIPVLVKALQEMKTIIDQQAERIAALEAK